MKTQHSKYGQQLVLKKGREYKSTCLISEITINARLCPEMRQSSVNPILRDF